MDTSEGSQCRRGVHFIHGGFWNGADTLVWFYVTFYLLRRIHWIVFIIRQHSQRDTPDRRQSTLAWILRLPLSALRERSCNLL